MSYQDLPVEERMQKAAEYALLSIDSDLPQEEVICEIQQTFCLSEAQAIAAFGRMRNDYRQPYEGAVNKSITRGAFSLLASVLAGSMYCLMGQESTIFLGLAFLFFLGGLGAVMHMGKKISERFSFTSKPTKRNYAGKAKEGKEEDHWTSAVLVFAFIIMVVSGYHHFSRSGYLDLDGLVTVKGLRIRGDITQGETTGKNPDYYYQFTFEGTVHHYRFFDEYYKWASHPMSRGLFQSGETVDITIRKADEAMIPEGFEPMALNMYNIYRDGVPLVDLGYRNDQILYKNRKYFYIGMALFVGALVLVLIFQGRPR